MTPLTVVLVLILFVIVGFMLVNRAYWSNQRYEAQYRRKRFEQLQRQREQG